MIDNKTYEKLVRSGERVEWYGTEVPEGLITNFVKVWSSSLKSEIDKLESTLSDLRGTSLDKRKSYINSLMSNLQNAPYSLNGDAYLIKKKRIESEIEEENKKKKPVRKRKTTKTKETTSKNTVTKNSSLIFGKK